MISNQWIVIRGKKDIRREEGGFATDVSSGVRVDFLLETKPISESGDFAFCQTQVENYIVLSLLYLK